MLLYFFAFVGFASLLTYFLPVLYHAILHYIFPQQNIKKKYSAEWALVTGGSSGIGYKIAERLLQQKINVVIVALKDQVLEQAVESLRKQYTEREVLSLALDLGDKNEKSYFDQIEKILNEKEIRLFFNNAGFMVPGLFHLAPLSKQLSNFHCNATASLALSHLFINHVLRLPLKDGKRGLLSFTSSSAGFLPTPLSSVYGSTKCFMTNFACALASEIKPDGVDVVVIHPSPVQTRFFDAAGGKIELLNFFQKAATDPVVVADQIFSAAGRVVVVDQGFVSAGFKMLLKVLDWNFMSEVAPLFIASNNDYINLKMEGKEKQMVKEE